MDADDLEPRAKPAQTKNLETLSLVELDLYIASLEAEIARARQMIDSKRGQRAGAEALFKR
jgi:uncharacterized small protein (DUF1192 family)